jgi:hypothetical protein
MSSLEPLGDLLCPHCGTRNPPRANFCNRCGAALADDLDLPATDPAAPLAESGFEADSAQRSAITAIMAEEPVSPEGGPVVAQIEERDLDQLLDTQPAGSEPSAQAAAQSSAQAIAPPDAAAPPEMGFVLFPDEQLLGGGQGYLESVAIAGDTPGPMAPSDRTQARPAAADNEHWRTLRSLLRDEPVLATATINGAKHPSYRALWITLLLLVAALAPFVLGDLLSAVGAPRVGPGIDGAYEAIANVQVDDDLIVYWQADPATTGELNMAALPVISHLLERGGRSIVISTLPAGIGAARRLYTEATRGMDNSVMETMLQGWVGNGLFLSGGTAALPLVARDPTQLLSFAPTNTPAPQMAVIVAAQAEDVQQWLQIVQPVNRLPVVAITAAGAEPVLQPYLASGQLAGLVSGFDGGAAYQALRAEPLSQQAQRKQMLAVGVQNSGAIALLFIILAGNMARLFRRERRG